LGPIPNPQSPIPNPQSPYFINFLYFIVINSSENLLKNTNIK